MPAFSVHESLSQAVNVNKPWLADIAQALVDCGFNGFVQGAALLEIPGAIVAVHPTDGTIGQGNPLSAEMQTLVKYLAAFAEVNDTLTINLANAADYCGRYARLNKATAFTVTFADDLPHGFCMSWIQVGAGKVTFAGSGLTLRHGLSHSKTARQYAMGGILVDGDDLRLFGETGT